jgi:hypothetical protein
MVAINEPVVAIAALIVALGVIIGAVIKVYKIAHRIDAALGVDAKGRTVADRLSRVEHQLWPNGGSSLPDKIARLEVGQTAQTSELRVVRDLLTVLVERR